MLLHRVRLWRQALTPQEKKIGKTANKGSQEKMNALYTKRNDFFQKRYQNRWIGYRRQKALGCHTKGNYTKPEELKTKRPASVSTNASLFMNSTVNLNTSVTGILCQLRSFVHLRSRNRHPILAKIGRASCRERAWLSV